MTKPFEVYPYSIATLEQLLAEKSGALLEVVRGKLHSLYFEHYFGALGAQSIIVENDYIDRDFLEDFAGYYVRCFGDYKRKCTRLHFFKRGLTSATFEELISSQLVQDQIQAMQADYLGFVVVKPLPQTVVGRTCLATYPEDQHRYYPITRRYESNVFGFPLAVNTLAFQEQDSVTAACATSALWSVFHGTGILFHHPIPSPVEITRAANAVLPMENRSLPSGGLTAMQMAHAIRSVGLEPFPIGARNEYLLRAAVYAYLRGRIPVLLGCDLFDTTSPTPELRGKHAVAVTGFSIANANPSPLSQWQNVKPLYAGFLLRASQIDKLYTHDDQVGPFARMVFDGQKVNVPVSGGNIAFSSLSTSWGLRQNRKVRACPEFLLVPLYHKIRIPFESILELVTRFDALLETLRQHGPGAPLSSRPTWDIYLSTVNTLKTEIAQSSNLTPELRSEIRVAKLPRFLWRASAVTNGQLVLDLLFDATDIEQGYFLTRAIEYDPSLSRYLRQIAREPQLEARFKTEPEYRVLSWFKAQPIS
jgi:hypothetical protein